MVERAALIAAYSAARLGSEHSQPQFGAEPYKALHQPHGAMVRGTYGTGACHMPGVAKVKSPAELIAPASQNRGMAICSFAYGRQCRGGSAAHGLTSYE